MLVLTRKVGDSIVISDNIEITIADISGDKVKLAIDAPKAITIMRKELLELKASNAEAATSSPNALSDLKNALKK